MRIKKKLLTLFSAGFLIFGVVAMANAAIVSTFSDRALFDAAVGPTTLERFTPSSHFPIPGGSLSATSSFGDLSAGDIQAGATYSTPVGSGSYFNIDAGAGFTGGFLDGMNPSSRDLTILYDPLILGFGFDTNQEMNNFDITINFLSGPAYNNNFLGNNVPNIMQFFGFQSDTAIQSVVISGNAQGRGFAIDNHAFGGTSPVPIPSSIFLFGSGLIGLVGLGYRRKKASA